MPLAFAIWSIGMSLLPTATAQCVLAGVAFGYVIYDLIHYYLHHGTPATDYFKDLKNYHVKHHYVYHELGKAAVRTIIIICDFVVRCCQKLCLALRPQLQEATSIFSQELIKNAAY